MESTHAVKGATKYGEAGFAMGEIKNALYVTREPTDIVNMSQLITTSVDADNRLVIVLAIQSKIKGDSTQKVKAVIKSMDLL
jgi:hypothetical protein